MRADDWSLPTSYFTGRRVLSASKQHTFICFFFYKVGEKSPQFGFQDQRSIRIFSGKDFLMLDAEATLLRSQ